MRPGFAWRSGAEAAPQVIPADAPLRVPGRDRDQRTGGRHATVAFRR